MISHSNLVIILFTLLAWTYARKFTVLRLKPATTADVEFLQQLLMKDVKLDFWKSPTEPGREVHVMLDDVAKKKTSSKSSTHGTSHTLGDDRRCE
ncbi:hypothetical protein OSTOST_06870, partial [Ostertagia ostertagi]